MKLVLLPGLDGTGVLFRPFLAALPATMEPVVISYPVREPLGYDELLALVVAQLSQSEPFVLLGESFGGPLSLRIAATAPPGLRGLILAGSFVSCPFDFVPSWTTRIVHPFPFRAFPLFAKLKGRFGMYESTEHLSLSMEALSQVAPEVFAHRLRAVIRVDAAKELATCAVPILYLQGKRDWVVPAGNVRRIQRIKPTVRVVQIDSAHMILKTRPVEAAQAIVEFVQRYC